MAKVLIAEDDRISGNLLKRYATQWGFQVLSASNGKEAWDIFQNNDIEIAILDWMMPEMDGIELCRRIREEKSEKYTYIILLTSKDDQKDINEGLTAGADDYITKPFNSGELNARLKTGKRIIDMHNKLHKIAIHDSLTKLYNHAQILSILEEEYDRALRENRPLSIIMLDIDLFKNVNDEYGHTIGDAVLVEVAARLQKSLRVYDKIGRYGGDEFLVILPNNNLKNVRSVAERLRCLISGEKIKTDAGLLEVTISLGCTSTESGESRSVEDIVNVSDRALYQAKHRGRDCVMYI